MPFCDFMRTKRCESIGSVCSDMWRAYLAVIAGHFNNAFHLLDRFISLGILTKLLTMCDVLRSKSSKKQENLRILKNVAGSF